MSRIGKLPISLPDGVEVTLDSRQIAVKGPKGVLFLSLLPLVKVKVAEGNLTVSVPYPDKPEYREQWGTARALIKNLVQGVTTGFSKQLELSGVGYRASMEGQNLLLALGFSHPVRFSPPPGISLSVEKNVITVSGLDRQLVGETAARLRALKKPEPYKGKGLKYVGEVIRRKAGKQVKG